MTFESDFRQQSGAPSDGLRVVGSSKQLKDEHIHEAIREELDNQVTGQNKTA